MMEHGVHHLVVVDGASRPSGVLRVADFASAEVRDPLIIRTASEHATTVDELADACHLLPSSAVELYDAGVPAPLRASRSPQFLRMLLTYSLSSRPPTGFVRDFVVEHSGEDRGQLNLKRGGLRPVTSLGRWVALITGDARGTTCDRLRRAVDARLPTRDESDTLIGAYDQIFSLQLETEVEAIRGGAIADTYLAPESLDTLTRRHLRESFRAIAHVQGRLESIWINRASG